MSVKEEVINTHIGQILGRHLSVADIKTETSGQLKRGVRRPDITILMSGREKVLVENKIASSSFSSTATNLTKQCEGRFDETWADGRPIRAITGIITPKMLGHTDGGLIAEVESRNDFVWSSWTPQRIKFPGDGWISGNLRDFAGFVDRFGANVVDIDDLTNRIRSTLDEIGLIIDEYSEIAAQFSLTLRQDPGKQTNRMGLAIIFNALVFQSHIAQNRPNIDSVSQMKSGGSINQPSVAKAWQQILKINYYPIFGTAEKLIRSIANTKIADEVLEKLSDVAIDVSKEPESQGLIGNIFGELISDRKLLASFYTLPTSAALISELAVERVKTNWSNNSEVENLKVADFAVGTGTLLVSTYKRIAERYLLSGNDPEGVHRSMMEKVMTGCDIDPAAVHITASRLAGEHPNVDYGVTQTFVMPYGDMGHLGIKIGSLDLLSSSSQISFLGSGEEMIQSHGSSIRQAHIPDESMDLVIMNPPFTRSTNHESSKKEIPIPTFAGLKKSESEQKEMAKSLNQRLRETKHKPLASNGNAGLATNFMDLAHVKLKPGGILALIIPSTFLQGGGWSNMRGLLSRYYRDILVVSLSATGKFGRKLVQRHSFG